MKLFETENVKVFRSKDINYNFDKRNGLTATWGKTLKDDPEMSNVGPMILDIEITDICKGVGDEGPCPFCYKSNKPTNDSNMSFLMFKSIIDRMPKINNIPVLQQLAIGADAQCESNPDTFNMMRYARAQGIIPNVTVADISDETADKLVEVCGAVAVSRYENKEYCYDSIKKLTDRGLKQTNMHILVSNETLEQVLETFDDYLNGEPRLKGLNAIVLLSLKTKGRGKSFTPLSQEKFKKVVDYAMDNNIPIGFDSCGCNKFLESVKDRKDFKQLEMMSEPCESGLFSSYINSKGEFSPCSFCENTEGWESGIKVDTCVDFLKDVWYDDRTIKFRNMLLKNDRKCPIYNV